GTIRDFGTNANAELGIGSTSPSYAASAQTPSISSVAHISGGWYYSAAITTDGTIWTWGDNGMYELGDSTVVARRLSQTQISGISNVVEVAAGTNPAHSLAVTTDGTVYAWGYNGNGEIGDGTTNWSNVPVPISGPNFAWGIATPIFSLG